MLLISRCRYFCTARRRRGIIVPSYSHGYVLRILHSKAYLTAQSTLLFCIPQASMPGCDLNADVYGVYSVLSSRLSWSRGEMQNAKQCIQNNACARVPNSLRDIHNFINEWTTQRTKGKESLSSSVLLESFWNLRHRRRNARFIIVVVVILVFVHFIQVLRMSAFIYS